jgi:hypothetical protein
MGLFTDYIRYRTDEVFLHLKSLSVLEQETEVMVRGKLQWSFPTQEEPEKISYNSEVV